jgi:hypothetical protein
MARPKRTQEISFILGRFVQFRQEITVSRSAMREIWIFLRGVSRESNRCLSPIRAPGQGDDRRLPWPSPATRFCPFRQQEEPGPTRRRLSRKKDRSVRSKRRLDYAGPRRREADLGARFNELRQETVAARCDDAVEGKGHPSPAGV